MSLISCLSKVMDWRFRIDNKGYGFSEKPNYFDPPGYKIEDLKQVITALWMRSHIVVMTRVPTVQRKLTAPS